MERLTTGNGEVDKILVGGFPTNAIHVLMGAPGTGKTILAEQICFANASPGRPILYVSTFSEPLQKLVGFLQEFSFAKAEKLGTEIVYEYIGEDMLMAPERLPERLQELLIQHRPKIIVIDSFKALADLMPERSAWRRTLDAITGMLTAYDTTTFWVGEYMAEMMSDLPEFAVADGIVDLTRAERGSRDERFLRVLKLRGSGFLAGHHAVHLGPDGIEAFRRFITPADPPRLPPRVRAAEERHRRSGRHDRDRLAARHGDPGRRPVGSGKTSLGMQFLRAGVDEGEPGLLASFQESPTQLVRMMSQPRLGTGEAARSREARSLLHVSGRAPDRHGGERDRAPHRKDGVKRVVIDAVTDLEKGSADPLRYRDLLYSLTQLFAEQNVTSMLLVETVGAYPGHAVTGYEVSYMSDNILLLEVLLGEDLTRTIRILKSRGSEHDGRRHRLRITRSGVAVD